MDGSSRCHGSPPTNTTWRIGVDVGGTFTDLVLALARGATSVAKVPSSTACGGLARRAWSSTGPGVDVEATAERRG